ncbi:MAG: (Fe-S)-binding protein [Flavobacteriales bacterium]|nr:(Fe-S)-binding protein [Flavobacteriales bacterium]
MGLGNIIFIVCLIIGIGLFIRRIRQIRFFVAQGKDVDISDRKSERWATMARVAMGQSKMVDRPIAGLLHIVIYVGFVLINIEVLEILIDGIFGTHRFFADYLGRAYGYLIAFIEILALLVFVVCVIFLIRRNIMHIRRFHLSEMTKWPKADANIILIAEILLMGALLKMNATDQLLQERIPDVYHEAGSFPVSAWLTPFFQDFSTGTLITFERMFWWFHILGILAFLNYVPYSKHFHIFLAFPNTFYSNLEPRGRFDNMESVKREVELMMDPSADPYAAPPADAPPPETFGAKDVTDLTWKNLLDAYSCTECGRCSSVCPANMTGKKLSPRKIMMDTRDRAEELGNHRLKNGKEEHDGRSLLHDFITEEELWACTSCNACVEACPVLIDPLDIIMDLRRNLIMEESKSPESITAMFNNIENNGAPWAFSMADRDKWTTES